MHHRNNNYLKSQKKKFLESFNIPIECIRKTRSLNIDPSCCNVSWEVYKILKSTNGRKIFA